MIQIKKEPTSRFIESLILLLLYKLAFSFLKANNKGLTVHEKSKITSPYIQCTFKVATVLI